MLLGSLSQHAAGVPAERFALQNPHVLAVRLGPEDGHEVVARAGAMIACTGNVSFDGLPVPPHVAQMFAYTGESVDLMRCQGTGVVYLAHLAQSIVVLDVGQGGVTVDGQFVLALEPQLMWTLVAVESAHAIAAVGPYNLDIQGRGKLALMCSGRPVVLRVDHGREVFADADAVIAWSTNLVTRLEAQVTSSRVWRRRGSTGEGWTMAFQGDGYVVVQPSELLPPAEFVRAGGYRGMGRGGYRQGGWGG